MGMVWSFWGWWVDVLGLRPPFLPPPSHRYRWGLPRRLSCILIAIMFARAYPSDFHIDFYCIMVAGARPGISVVCVFNISLLYANCCLAQVASFL